MKIALQLSYLGTRYHGWQRQKNALSVQELIENAVAQLSGTPVYVSGCGRTDAGVHAHNYVASVAWQTSIPMDRLPLALNGHLPEDVVISAAQVVEEDFDARFSCVAKEYTYTILNRLLRDTFRHDRAWLYPRALDVDAMERGGRMLVGTHDFKALQSAGSPKKSTVRTIRYCHVERDGDQIAIRVAADGFLYNMVRCIAGTLVYCGIGKLKPEGLDTLLAGGSRELAGPTAPPWGLCMTRATYNPPLFGQQPVE